MATNVNNEQVLHEQLKQFQQYWDESFNGNYQNYGNLISLTKRIIKANYAKDIINQKLSLTERTTYAHVEILYKTLTH